MRRILVGLAFLAALGAPAGAAENEGGDVAAPGVADIPEDFLGAPAVVLEDRRYWDVVPTRRATYRVKRRIAILDRRGFEYADQMFWYDAYSASLESFVARTILGDGRVIEVPEDLRHEFVAFRDENLDLRSMHFTFPAVEIGAVLEWVYTLAEQDPPLVKHWEVQGDLPVLWSRFLLQLKQPPSMYALQARAYSRVNEGDRCEVVEDRSGARGARFEMICRDVPAHRDEPEAPPAADSVLEFLVVWASGEPEKELWRMKGRGWTAFVDAFVEKRPKVRALAAELVREGMSDQEKINAVYDYVKREIETREVYYAPRQKGKQSSFETVDQVLDAGGGLPSEITMLTLALLRDAGMQAQPVLVQDRSEGRFVPDYPDPRQVDHLMLRVNVDGHDAVLDPSCRYCQAGMPEWRYCGRGETGLRLGGMPVPFEVGVVPARNSSEIREQRARLSPDGALTVEGTVTWSGQYDIDMRRRWENLSAAGRRDDFIEGLPGDVGAVRVEISDPRAFFENLSVRYAYDRSDLPPLSDGRLLIRPADVFTAALPIPMQESRTQPVWIRYPYTIRSEIAFELPAGFAVDRIPPNPESLVGAGLIFEYGWRGGERSNEVVWTGLLTVGRLEIPAEEYPEARDFARRLRLVLRSGLVASGPAVPSSGGAE